jgi:hypothetical protein
MTVDEPGDDDASGGVDDLVRLVLDMADGGYLPVLDEDIPSDDFPLPVLSYYEASLYDNAQISPPPGSGRVLRGPVIKVLKSW